MSLKTWKKEFYKREAWKVKTWKAAVNHSIKKWEGLLPENLKKHGIVQNFDEISSYLIDEVYGFVIDGGSCALCCLCDSWCYSKCVVLKVNKERPCQNRGTNEYGKWTNGGDPKPMIKLLKKAKKYIEAGKWRKRK